MKNEVWKDVVSYEGLYQVSNLGRIKSLNFNGTGKEKIMRPRTGNRYYMIALWKNGIRKDYLLHRIVAETFIPNPENKPFINHKDENCFNNSINNLMWCTHKENMNNPQTLLKIVEARKGKTQSKETIEKIKLANTNGKCSKPVLALKNGEICVFFHSTSEAGRNGYCIGNISSCCNGIRKTHKGYQWQYVDDYLADWWDKEMEKAA